MVNIYLHKWDASMGKCIENGRLTSAAKTWQRALNGLTASHLSVGFAKLKAHHPDWPPGAFEFYNLCQEASDATSIHEAIKILTCGTGDNRTIASRNQHPIVLAIRGKVDMHQLRTMTSNNAYKLIKPIYDDLLKNGIPNWPEHAFEEQQSLDKPKPTRNKDFALSNLKKIRQITG